MYIVLLPPVNWHSQAAAHNSHQLILRPSPPLNPEISHLLLGQLFPPQLMFVLPESKSKSWQQLIPAAIPLHCVTESFAANRPRRYSGQT